MTSREQYAPGAAHGANIEKNGETWTLVLVRDLRHPPAKVWKALIEPEQLQKWAPFDSDRSLGTPGTVKLTTIGAPQTVAFESQVKRVVPEKALEYDWGGNPMRWELEPQGAGGTRLTLWAVINRNYIAMGAAGWHICFDVLDSVLAGDPISRIAGPSAMQVTGWQRLQGEYTKQFKET